MTKILIVYGTRPEAIKLAPLIHYLKNKNYFMLRVCVTAQHREMLDLVSSHFTIEPDYDLNLMKPGQTLTEISSGVLNGLNEVLHKEKPDLVLVQGDTTTTFSAALAAFYNQVALGHVEAGLRSGNKFSPYPEEMNRRLTSALADLHFAPTELNKSNLLADGVEEDKIFVTGNTVIDALHMVVKDHYHFRLSLLNSIVNDGRKIILLTTHRRENWGAKLKGIFEAVKQIIRENEGVIVVFPVHPNPVVRDLAYRELKAMTQVHLIEPLCYDDFANLLAKSYLVLTDSGGLQEEAPALNKPVLLLRTETERQEALKAGTVAMAGIEKEVIADKVQELLVNPKRYNEMAQAENPYGDGQASKRITEALCSYFQ